MIAGSEPLAPRIRLRQVCIPATSEGGEGDQGDKERGGSEGSTGWDPDGNVSGFERVVWVVHRISNFDKRSLI